MKISGIVKSSFIDYPGQASTVLFCGGCNFACGYCHNPELVNKSEAVLPEEEILSFLLKRRRFLDAVCVTGGEPTLQKDLKEFFRKIKQMGFLIKLDTNGSRPDVLEDLIENKLVDYVAMDIKGPVSRYKDIVRKDMDPENILKSAKIILKTGHEYRTTVAKEVLNENDFIQIKEDFPTPEKWFLQSFKNPGKILDSEGTYTAYSIEEMKKFGEILGAKVR